MGLAEIADDFALFDSWEDRYRYIIDLGRALEPLPDELKSEDRLVRGCISRVWLVPRVETGPPPRLHLRADSDAAITKGLIALLLQVYDGRTADEILATDLDEIFRELELESHISPNRRNGFVSMVETIRQLARRAQAGEV